MKYQKTLQDGIPDIYVAIESNNVFTVTHIESQFLYVVELHELSRKDLNTYDKILKEILQNVSADDLTVYVTEGAKMEILFLTDANSISTI